MVARMVNRIVLERILADIKTNVKELRDAKDVTLDLYRLTRLIIHVALEA